jgi:hypothetical protein
MPFGFKWTPYWYYGSFDKVIIYFIGSKQNLAWTRKNTRALHRKKNLNTEVVMFCPIHDEHD